MGNITLGEMLRLGGWGAALSFGLGVLVVALVIVGYVIAATYARTRPNGPLARAWAWVILLAGLICALNAGVGTLSGLANVHRAAAAAGGGTGGDVLLGVGAYEVLYNVAFGVMFAWLALFGYATARLVAATKE